MFALDLPLTENPPCEQQRHSGGNQGGKRSGECDLEPKAQITPNHDTETQSVLHHDHVLSDTHTHNRQAPRMVLGMIQG